MSVPFLLSAFSAYMLRANFISLWFLFFLVSLVSLFLGISRPDSGENKTGMGGMKIVVVRPGHWGACPLSSIQPSCDP